MVAFCTPGVAVEKDAPCDVRTADLLWADIGEMLQLTVAEMRDLRSTFGEVLGLGSTRSVPRPLVPAIEYIVKERRDGTPDLEISKRLKGTKETRSWPEQVLARMEAASTETAPPLPAATHSTREGAAGTPAEIASDSKTAPDTAITYFPDQLSSPHEEDLPVREMIQELRSEIQRRFAAERQDLLRLDQALRRLSLEVRDMRYALLLAFSRRDRKRGKKGISNLLLG